MRNGKTAFFRIPVIIGTPNIQPPALRNFLTQYLIGPSSSRFSFSVSTNSVSFSLIASRGVVTAVFKSPPNLEAIPSFSFKVSIEPVSLFFLPDLPRKFFLFFFPPPKNWLITSVEVTGVSSSSASALVAIGIILLCLADILIPYSSSICLILSSETPLASSIPSLRFILSISNFSNPFSDNIWVISFFCFLVNETL